MKNVRLNDDTVENLKIIKEMTDAKSMSAVVDGMINEMYNVEMLTNTCVDNDFAQELAYINLGMAALANDEDILVIHYHDEAYRNPDTGDIYILSKNFKVYGDQVLVTKDIKQTDWVYLLDNEDRLKDEI